jgi:Trp operon repressor
MKKKYGTNAALIHLFSSISSPREAEILLQDMLTPKEMRVLAERWEIIQELATGKTQREIAELLGLSISKVTRGSAAWQRGSGGFRHFMKKISPKGKK